MSRFCVRGSARSTAMRFPSGESVMVPVQAGLSGRAHYLSLPIEPSQTTLDGASGTGLCFLRTGKGKAQSDCCQYYEKCAPGH
jgi:hypothetical protein